MRVSEDGDELVRVDLRLNGAERGMAALVCKRGGHCAVGREETKGKGAHCQKGGTEWTGERGVSPCTRHTSPRTCASANFRCGIVIDDGEGDDDEGDSVACTAVAIVQVEVAFTEKGVLWALTRSKRLRVVLI